MLLGLEILPVSVPVYGPASTIFIVLLVTLAAFASAVLQFSSLPGRLVLSLAPAGAVGHSCIRTRMWSNDLFCFQLSPPLLWQCLSVAPYVTLTLIYFLLFLSFRDTPTAGSSCLLERWRLWWLLVAIGAELEFCCSPFDLPPAYVWGRVSFSGLVCASSLGRSLAFP